jgi:hypothetical protein
VRLKLKARMRFAAVAVLATAGVYVCGCGRSQSTPADSRPPVAARTGASPTRVVAETREADGDADGRKGEGYYDFDEAHIFDFGNAADPATRRSMARVVRRYYAEAAAEHGQAACGLMASKLKSAVPRTYGEGSAPPALRGRTCASVMTKLFRRLHGRIGLESATLQTGLARVAHRVGYLVLGFGGERPMFYMPVRQENGAWKIAAVVENGVP